MPALHARFQNHTLRFVQRHGITPVGFREGVIGTRDVLRDLPARDDLAQREPAWDAFRADGEWLMVRDESQRDDPIVARIRNEFWQWTRYSLLREAEESVGHSQWLTAGDPQSTIPKL